MNQLTKVTPWQEYFKNKTDEEMIVHARTLHDMAYGPVECFGVRDLIELDAATAELVRRGYSPVKRLEFVKDEQDEEGDDENARK